MVAPHLITVTKTNSQGGQKQDTYDIAMVHPQKRRDLFLSGI